MILKNVMVLFSTICFVAYCGETVDQASSKTINKIDLAIATADTAAFTLNDSTVDSTDAVSLGIVLEKQSMDHYKSLETAAPTKALAAIFKLLVRDETKHYNLLLSWKKEIPFKAPINTDILSVTKEIMRIIAEFPADSVLNDQSQKGENKLQIILQNDLALEREAIFLYVYAREKTNDDGQKMMFSFLVKEEKNHAHLLEKLIAYSKQPVAWLKNAEYKNLEK